MGRQAGLMSLGTFVSRVLGLARDLSISAFFSKTETDIFFVAFRFPNFFRRLFGEGSFSASVTPMLAESLQKKGETKKLYSSLWTFLFCASGALSLLGILFMKEIMDLFFAGSAYARIEGKLEKTVLVGRLVFSYLFFVSLYSFFMSTAQVFGRFFISALAPAFFNLSLIIFAWTPKSWWPFPALSLAWAVIFGGILQLLPVLFEMRRLNMPFRFNFNFKNPAFLKTGRRFLPGMLGLSGLSLIGLINVYFAGRLEEGAPSYIYYGDRLLELPRALIAVSLGTALIPELSRQFASNRIADLKKTANYYMRFLLFLTLPCALVFALSAQPLVQLIFGRGEFDSSAVFKTAMVLEFYSLVLIFSSLSRVLSSCFFALNKNWIMALCSLFFVCFHGLCAGLLTPAYGLKGLAGATALSSAFYFAILFGFLFRALGGLNLRPLVLLKTAPGLALLALCLLALPHLINFLSLFAPPFWALLLALFLSFLLGGGFYILSGILLKEQMAFAFLSLFKKFFKRKKFAHSEAAI